MSYYIPFEIQAEIMKRLPVKSLIQLESVCKAWKSFILSSEFIADYNTCRPQHCLLVTFRDYSFKEKYVSVFDDDTFPLRKLSLTIPSSMNLLNTLAKFGSSQGLFCFCGYSQGKTLGTPIPMAVIWNPSIRKSVDIVVPHTFNWLIDRTLFGFGVCPRTFDPMLVKISYIQNVDTIANYTPTQVEIYTLSSGAWKSRSINLPRESIEFIQDYSLDLAGFIYWLATDHDFDNKGVTDEGHSMIMSFDMTSEDFVEISLPDSLENTCYSRLSISKRMESLVVLEYNFIAKKQVCIVWMMEGGVHKSFIKIFTIEAPEASIRRVLGFWKSGEPIIAMDYEGSYPVKVGVYLYEPNSRHVSYIGIFAYWDLRFASSYTNTLLLLDQ